MGHQIVSCRAQPYHVYPKGLSHGPPRPFQGTGLSGEAPASHWGGGGADIKEKNDKAETSVALAVHSVLALGWGQLGHIVPREPADWDSLGGIFGEGCGVNSARGRE